MTHRLDDPDHWLDEIADEDFDEDAAWGKISAEEEARIQQVAVHVTIDRFLTPKPHFVLRQTGRQVQT